MHGRFPRPPARHVTSIISAGIALMLASSDPVRHQRVIMKKSCLRTQSPLALLLACAVLGLLLWILSRASYQLGLLVCALFAASVALTATLLKAAHTRLRDKQYELRTALRKSEQARGSLADAITRGRGELKQAQTRLQAEVAQRERYQRLAQQNAYLDPLTMLPNRSFLKVDLDKALAAAKRGNACVAVMFLDLDNFKRVNDTFGHSFGDEILKQAAGRLSACLRSEDTLVRVDDVRGSSVARIGGDEFVLLMRNAPDTGAAARVSHRVNESFQVPFVVDGKKIQVSVSIGVACYPNDGDSAEALIKNADTAMYRAKEKGRNMVQLYSRSMSAEAYRRLATENSLRKAIERKQLTLLYQPQVDSRSHRLVGVEALVRLNTPERGLVAPREFIQVAEDTGLIVPIGEWVLMEACRQLRVWQNMGLAPSHVAVNVSSLQFGEDRLLSALVGALKEHGIAPQLLELEVTENLLMKKMEATVNTLRYVREMGASVALDDFGTGYSSFAYLRRLPVDAVKIDRSFVRGLEADGGQHQITSAIVNLAHVLGLKAIAEGVETQTQTKALLEMGCDHMQGYLFAPPLDALAMTQVLFQGTVPMQASLPTPANSTPAMVSGDDPTGEDDFNGEETLLDCEFRHYP